MTQNRNARVKRNILGRFHSEDGPAIEFESGSKLWYKHGHRHRIDGPAIEYANGKTEYWVNGVFCETREQYELGIEIYKEQLLTAT